MFGSNAHVLYDDGNHKCLMFYNLVKGSGIQSNQFLIIDHGRGAVIDPGGDLTFAPLTVAIGKHIKLSELDFILASHQDPDIISALGRWMMQTEAKVVCSRLWSRFLPHLAASYLEKLHGQEDKRILALPDRGGMVSLGQSELYAVPGHFLHSVGNFNFYDRNSRILFSGDVGASMCEGKENEAVTDFDAHIPTMKSFHQRYMCSNKVCRLWADMVAKLDVSMIVPQHGKRFEGENIKRFLNWLSELKCGVDIVQAKDFKVNLLPNKGNQIYTA